MVPTPNLKEQAEKHSIVNEHSNKLEQESLSIQELQEIQ